MRDLLDLTPERWNQIRRLLDDARRCPPGTRSTFLDAACGRDALLRAQVGALLAADEAAGTFMGDAAVEQAAALLLGPDAPPEAEQFAGPYHLVRLLGRGGMGLVYLATRADAQFEKQVAVKMLPRGLTGGDLHARFLAERRVLARLEHPGIARLYDGGVTDDGLPYFVMEYVDGMPLTAYCDAHRLSIPDRLRLFMDVCRAVQYAHQNLIVHRDLKPSNILVTAEGRVKLLDFGIAKLLLPGEDEALTRTGMPVLTPEYAAPEQVRGEAVTTATDVYALGVVLYELLSGQRPYVFERYTPSAIEQVVCEVVPPPPSAVVDQAPPPDPDPDAAGAEHPSPDAVSRARRLPADRLRRRLSGDLDTIVLKALRKEPARRYTSAEQLLEDVRRHLAGLPVAARRDTTTYRVVKFVRRHRRGVATGVAALVVLMGLAAFHTYRVTQERDRARLEAAKAEEVKTFLVNLFELTDPDRTGGDTLTVREALERGARRIEHELRAQPAIQADLMDVLAEAYMKLGLYDRALPLSERVLGLRRTLHGPHHPDVARSLYILGRVRFEQGDYEAADSLFGRSLAMRRTLPGETDLAVAETLNEIAILRTRAGDFEAADSLYRTALALYRAARVPEHPSVATLLFNYAMLQQDLGAFDTAEAMMREALVLNRKLHGDAHGEVADNLAMLGYVVFKKGDYDTAEAYMRDALQRRLPVLGEAHPTVVSMLNNLAQLATTKGDLDAADSLNRRILALDRRMLGPSHPYVAADMGNLAIVLHQKGELHEAEQLARAALALDRTHYDDGRPELAVSINTLGLLLKDAGAFDEAEALLLESLSMRRRLFGDVHVDVGTALNSLGLLRQKQERFDEAQRYFEQALATWEAAVGRTHPIRAFGMSNLGELHRQRGRYAAADSLFRSALRVLEPVLPATSPRLTHLRLRLGRSLTAQRRAAEAESLLRAALEAEQQRTGERGYQTAPFRTGLAACLTDLRRYDEAEPLLLAAYADLTRHPAPDPARLQETRRALVGLYTALGTPTRAAPYR